MKKRIRWNTETFKNFCADLHKSKYKYEKLKYKSLHHKIIITCPEHGDFFQIANSHKNGKGCKKCAIEIQKKKQRSTTEKFIEKAIQKHKNKYIYNKTVYGKNAHQKVTITCPIHGDFLQSPNGHLSNGGCLKCAQETTSKNLINKGYYSWSRSGWNKICKGKIAKLYIIKLTNLKESFYKVGITSQDNISNRFNKIPYNWELVKLVLSFDPDYIYDLEKRFLKKVKRKKYLPEINFEGSTECFKS